MRFHPRQTLVHAAIAAMPLALLLPGCGGGSGSAPAAPGVQAPPAASAQTLSGTAATGAAISGQVVAIDVNGVVSPPATTTAAGAFTVDVSGMTGPFILSVIGTANGQQVSLTSVATAAGQTVNVTPLTDLIVSTAAGQPAGTSLVNACQPTVTAQCQAALASATSGSNLTSAVQTVKTMIQPINPGGTDPLNGSFQADGTGLDKTLDQILVSPATAQGATATVTLIATKTDLGSVALAGTAGTAPTTQVTAPVAADLTKSDTAAAVLNEIKACVATFNGAFANGAVNATTVGNFFDAAFDGGGGTKADIVNALTTGPAASGFHLGVVGLSPFDMTPLDSTERGTLVGLPNPVTAMTVLRSRATSAVALDGNGAPTAAWVRLKSTADAGMVNWKFAKGAAYAGCAGGWRALGDSHLEMHMNARIRRSVATLTGAASYNREYAVHVERDDVTALNTQLGLAPGAINAIVVRSPAVSQYRGPSLPPDAGARVVLTAPAGLNTSWRIGSGTSTVYGTNAEALRSCQDLAAANVADPGATTNHTLAAYTPCIDETKVAPGSLFSWEVKTGGANGTVVHAFAFQITGVPLSAAFAQANASNLFATVTATTPPTLAALNTAIAGAGGGVLDNVVTYTYAQGTAYGSRMDNCGFGLFQGGTQVLQAEQNALNQETGCTFATSTLNSGSLQAPGGAVNGGYVSTTTIVLGNQASSSRPWQP